jgi:hypothetical protein
MITLLLAVGVPRNIALVIGGLGDIMLVYWVVQQGS